MPHTPAATPNHPPDWQHAPGPEWRWLAQDADGQWFWYRSEPQLNWPGGVWRSNSRNQLPAAAGQPNADWMDTLRIRPE